jgi:hypothetical protein
MAGTESSVSLDVAVLHDADCTWESYREPAPGTTVWGQLNYEWCRVFCHWGPLAMGRRIIPSEELSDGRP